MHLKKSRIEPDFSPPLRSVEIDVAMQNYNPFKSCRDILLKIKNGDLLGLEEKLGYQQRQ